MPRLQPSAELLPGPGRELLAVEDRIQFLELDSLEGRAGEDLLALMAQLSPGRNIDLNMLQAVLDAPQCHLFVARTSDTPSRIVGCATLCVYTSPTGRKSSLEDVIVDSALRGHHLGKRLLGFILEEARRRWAPLDIHLTSRPERVAANALYQAMGFQLRKTNPYNLHIDKE